MSPRFARRTLPVLLALALGTSTLAGVARADGVLTIGRDYDSNTFDPIATAENVDFWCLMNVYDVLVRVNADATALEPGLAESWTVSDDGLVYTFTMRDARFSDGSPITAEDAAYTLLRVRDDEGSLWPDSYSIIDTAEVVDPKTLKIVLKTPSAPFLSSLAMPATSIVSKAGMESMGAEAYAENPIASGAFTVDEWLRGDRVVLKKNPEFWEADRVSLDGVEWIAVPDDNTRMLQVQAGELDAAIFVPFSRVAELQADEDLKVLLEPSTREDHMVINHSHGKLADVRVREAIDMAVDKQAIVDAVTFGIGQVANSYIPAGALYHDADNLERPHDPEAAKALLKEAGAEDLKLDYVVAAGNEVSEQIAVLMQQQFAEAGITATLTKVDPGQQWGMLLAGDYDISVNYWTNDILDPDQKTTFVLGHDTNMNYMTRYENPEVEQLVKDARVELDEAKRADMYERLQEMAKADVNWIDLYYSPFRNVVRADIEGFHQNPMGRFFLEDTVKR